MTDLPIDQHCILTWQSAAERNRRLLAWRKAVMSAFGEQPRCLRVAWVLSDLFNVKLGYAYPSNEYLARETGIAINKVQEALAALEKGGTVVRTAIRLRDRKQRVIYPSTKLLPTPTAGVGRHPQKRGVQNLNGYRKPSQMTYARLAAERRELDQRIREGSRAGGAPTKEETT